MMMGDAWDDIGTCTLGNEENLEGKGTALCGTFLASEFRHLLTTNRGKTAGGGSSLPSKYLWIHALPLAVCSGPVKHQGLAGEDVCVPGGDGGRGDVQCDDVGGLGAPSIPGCKGMRQGGSVTRSSILGADLPR